MKPLFFFLLAVRCFAETLTFTNQDGTVISGEIRRIEPDGIVLMNPEFLKKFPFDELPSEIATRYGYDPQKASSFKKQLQQNTESARAAATQFEENKTRKTELSKKAEEKKFWGIQNFANGIIAHPGIVVGGGVIKNSMASIGGGGNSAYIPPSEVPSAEWVYIEGIKNVAMGDQIKLKVYRDGSIQRGDETLQRWVVAD